jgi:tRNA-dihydrouridine synthase B
LAAWYSAGYPGSANFRKQIFTLIEEKEMLLAIQNYFANIEIAKQQDTSHEPFLMGGHG